MKRFLIAALLVPSIASAQGQRMAQPAASAKPVARGQLVRELDAAFVRIDSNRDGAILGAEAEAAQQRAEQSAAALSQKRAEQQFAGLDADKNGQLSLAEFKAAAAVPQMARGEAVLGLLDANKDQKVTVEEFRAERLAQFDALDSNRDGMVTAQETQAATARRR